jgi:hypothetical protein
LSNNHENWFVVKFSYKSAIRARALTSFCDKVESFGKGDKGMKSVRMVIDKSGGGESALAD